MNIDDLPPNKGKRLIIRTEGGSYARYPVLTRLIMPGDKLEDILKDYVQPFLAPNDMILICEKAVAIARGRALPISKIKVSRLARACLKNHSPVFGPPSSAPKTV